VVDDSSDCIIQGQRPTTTTNPDFDSRLVGYVFSVSENTRHRSSRRPISSASISTRKVKTTSALPNQPSSLPVSSTQVHETSTSLPIIPEDDDDIPFESLPHTVSHNEDNTRTTTSSPLSTKQIQEILNFVTKQLEKNGCISPALLKHLDPNNTPTKISSSSIPPNHPTLLSSDKMSSTAPSSMQFKVQQFSRYFGFWSFKNWDVLYDVCQPNFSFIKPSDNFLELGHMANIKKARSNKTPVERPEKFLEVVHCNIGFGDCKSICNGALYCLTLVDRATRYSWIYPLKNLHHESLKLTFQQWLINCGGSPSRLYTDFDPKILDGPTSCFLWEKNIILRGAPSGRQNENGLVKRAWETATNMA